MLELLGVLPDARVAEETGLTEQQVRFKRRALGIAPAAAFIEASDTRNYLGPLGDLVVTGPTGTNVVDVVTLLAGPARARGL